MKNTIYNSKILLGALLLFTSLLSAHPIKLTSSLIQYNPETSQLEIECRVFMDDFLYSITDQLNRNINLTDLSKIDRTGIEAYFKEHYVISLNGKRSPLRYVMSEVLEEHNVCIFKFSQDVDTPQEGDQLCIENTLFFKEFDILQNNMVTVRIPPLVDEVYFEAIVSNYSLPIDI